MFADKIPTNEGKEENFWRVANCETTKNIFLPIFEF